MVLILSMGILTLGYCVYTPRVKQPFTFDKSLTLGGYGCVAEITRTQAETFDGDTHDDYSRPVNTYLPKGTLDYCSGEIVSDSGKAYRGLLFGKRIYSEDAGIYYCRIPVDNKVSAKEYYVSGRHSYIEIGTLWKAPFSVRLNQQFYKEPKANPPDYSIDSQEFMYFDITFNYACLLYTSRSCFRLLLQ